MNFQLVHELHEHPSMTTLATVVDEAPETTAIRTAGSRLAACAGLPLITNH